MFPLNMLHRKVRQYSETFCNNAMPSLKLTLDGRGTKKAKRKRMYMHF